MSLNQMSLNQMSLNQMNLNQVKLCQSGNDLVEVHFRREKLEKCL